MARYYNADTLLEFVKQNTPHIDGQTTMQCVERAILETPTVYVEEVVRCKHCKYYKASQCHRFSGKMIITPYFYCAYGEKENGQ